MALTESESTESTFSAGSMLSDVRRIVAFGTRRPGSPQGLAVERFLEQAFVEAGLTEVRLEPVPVHCWEPRLSRLEFPGQGVEIPCFPVPFTAWTPPGGARAPSIFVGAGDDAEFGRADVAGRIVVAEMAFAELDARALRAGARFIHDPATTIPEGPIHAASWLIENFPAYYRALAGRAAAFVGVLREAPVDGPDFYVPYDGFLKDLPAVWAGRESARALRELATREAIAALESTGKTTRIDSHNVVGTLPGSGGEHVVVTSHHDAPFASAVEDASGLAVLLALARHFTGAPRRLCRSLTFLAASGHFHGGIGCRAFVERHRHGLLEKTTLALGIEHVGEEAEAGDGGYRLSGRPELRALFVDDNPRLLGLLEERVRARGLDRTLALDPYLFGSEPPCDSAPFFTAGVPSVCHITGPLYLFDPHDTIDKVRARDLPRVAGLFADLVTSLDEVPAAELEAGLRRRRGDDPPPPPPWFLPPEEHLRALARGRATGDSAGES